MRPYKSDEYSLYEGYEVAVRAFFFPRALKAFDACERETRDRLPRGTEGITGAVEAVGTGSRYPEVAPGDDRGTKTCDRLLRCAECVSGVEGTITVGSCDPEVAARDDRGTEMCVVDGSSKKAMLLRLGWRSEMA